MHAITSSLNDFVDILNLGFGCKIQLLIPARQQNGLDTLAYVEGQGLILET